MADNWVGFKNKNTSSCEREDHDFDEQDVWGECDYTSNINRVSKDKDSSSSSAWKNIPKGNAHALVSDESFVKGSSSSSSSSAPMNIPDWSKVYGKKNCKNGGLHGYDNEDGDDDEEGDMVPPHEWIARKLARSQISSFSVCEGMGRTLKGRDLSKVRNAILSKTGFIE